MSLIPPAKEDRQLLGLAAAVGAVATAGAQVDDAAMRTIVLVMGMVAVFGLAWKATPPGR